MNLLDGAVFCGVFLLTMGSVLWGWRKRRTGEADYFLMGRRLTLPFFVATLVATWYGGIFGVTQLAFEHGLYSWMTQGAFWYLAYFLFAFLLVKRVRQVRASTMPELAVELFGPRCRRFASALNFLHLVPIAYVISMGWFVSALTGWEQWVSVWIGVALVCAYSSWGGFRAVVFSDLIQFAVMCLAVALVLGFSVAEYGGLGFLRERLPGGHFSLMGGHGWAETFVWGFLAMVVWVHPQFYHRCFAAESEVTARRGVLWSIAVWMVFDLCITFGAMYARAALGDVPSGKAYFEYAMSLLPAGFRGFFVAGIFATVLSTLDSYLFLAAATFGKGRGRHFPAVLAVGAFAAVLSGFFEGGVAQVWLLMGGWYSAVFLVPFVAALALGWKVSDRAFMGIGSAAILAVVLYGWLRDSGTSLYAGLTISLVGVVFLGGRRSHKSPSAVPQVTHF